MADPRGGDIKSDLNEIKKRQKFRPFAPIILEEFAHAYFDMPTQSIPYMQFVVKVQVSPEMFPAIVHHDGTSRVQTVNRDQHPGLYRLLREFHDATGCPMLVNTSPKHQRTAHSKYSGRRSGLCRALWSRGTYLRCLMYSTWETIQNLLTD